MCQVFAELSPLCGQNYGRYEYIISKQLTVISLLECLITTARERKYDKLFSFNFLSYQLKVFCLLFYKKLAFNLLLRLLTRENTIYYLALTFLRTN